MKQEQRNHYKLIKGSKLRNTIVFDGWLGGELLIPNRVDPIGFEPKKREPALLGLQAGDLSLVVKLLFEDTWLECHSLLEASSELLLELKKIQATKELGWPKRPQSHHQQDCKSSTVCKSECQV